jgi:hypothetical protein
MELEHLWNDADRGNPKYSQRNLIQCCFVHNISHMDWSGSTLGLRGERQRLTARVMTQPVKFEINVNNI